MLSIALHRDRCTRRCTIYQERPVPCRAYDCRHDSRIWLDFDCRIPNPAIERLDWLQVVSQNGGASDARTAAEAR